jgi:hypothetical protein
MNGVVKTFIEATKRKRTVGARITMNVVTASICGGNLKSKTNLTKKIDVPRRRLSGGTFEATGESLEKYVCNMTVRLFGVRGRDDFNLLIARAQLVLFRKAFKSKESFSDFSKGNILQRT